MATKRRVRFTEESPHVFEYEQTELPEITKKKEQSHERKDWFTKMMSVSLGISTVEQRLDEVSFEGVAKYIADGKCSKIMTMVGAGISTSAGIPDYRSEGTGLMDMAKEKYPKIENVSDLFNIQYFLKDPTPFFERSKRFFQVSLKPTPCHYFVRLLHEKGLLLRHFTQNIDTLEKLAGLPAEKVVEAHGSYHTSHCIHCDAEYSFYWMEDKILRDEIPKCEEEDCDGPIKPDIVMFGESLPERFAELAEEDTLKCDLLIIMGTALAVQPFASLTSKVNVDVPRLYINLDRGNTAKKHPMTDVMFGGSFSFDCEDNIRDVHKADKCDDACYAMADILGWGEELRSLVKSEHARIDEEDKARGKEPKPATLITDTAKPSQKTSGKTPTVNNDKTGKNSSTIMKDNAVSKPKSVSRFDKSPRTGAPASVKKVDDKLKPKERSQPPKDTSQSGSASSVQKVDDKLKPRYQPPMDTSKTGSASSVPKADDKTKAKEPPKNGSLKPGAGSMAKTSR